MDIITKPTEKDVYETACIFILKRLEEIDTKKQEFILFLSGGSTVYVLDYVEANARHMGLQLPLTVALIDERCRLDRKRKDSNWDFIEQETGIISRLEKQGATLVEALSDIGDCFVQADAYRDTITKLLQGDGYKLGIFGIGADSHTAGMRSLDVKRFEELFLDDELVVVYDSPDAYEYRITMTGTAFEHLNEGVVIATGEPKRIALEDLRDAGTRDQKDMKIDDYASHPSWMLHKIPKLTLFTDQAFA